MTEQDILDALKKLAERVDQLISEQKTELARQTQGIGWLLIRNGILVRDGDKLVEQPPEPRGVDKSKPYRGGESFGQPETASVTTTMGQKAHPSSGARVPRCLKCNAELEWNARHQRNECPDCGWKETKTTRSTDEV